MSGVRDARRGRFAHMAAAGLLGAVLAAGPARAILPPPPTQAVSYLGESVGSWGGPVGQNGGGGTAVTSGTKGGPPPISPPLSVPPPGGSSPGGPPSGSPPGGSSSGNPPGVPLSGSPPPAVGAPEIDPHSLAAGLTLAAGGLLVLTDRLRRRKCCPGK